MLDPGGAVEYYLPPGVCTSLLTGEAIDGGSWRREVHDFHGLPLLVRPGAVLPLGARDDAPEYDYADGVTLRVHPPAAGATSLTIPGATGDAAAAFDVEREADTLRIARRLGDRPWAVELAGGLVVRGAEAGSVDADGRVRVDGGTGVVTLALG